MRDSSDRASHFRLDGDLGLERQSNGELNESLLRQARSRESHRYGPRCQSLGYQRRGEGNNSAGGIDRVCAHIWGMRQYPGWPKSPAKATRNT